MLHGGVLHAQEGVIRLAAFRDPTVADSTDLSDAQRAAWENTAIKVPIVLIRAPIQWLGVSMRPAITASDPSWAIFLGNVDFQGSRFPATSNSRRSRFGDGVNFSNATFSDGVNLGVPDSAMRRTLGVLSLVIGQSLRGTRFRDNDGSFGNATFGNEMEFGGARSWDTVPWSPIW